LIAGARVGRVLVTACALLAPAATHATELPLELTWEAPPECPSAAVVRAELERVVRVRRGRTVPRLIARAQIESHDGRWHLRLQTLRDNVAGERRLEASSCASLVGAATLVLGLAFGEGVELATDTLLLEPRPSSTASTASAASTASTPARPKADSQAPAAATPPPPLPRAPIEERPPPTEAPPNVIARVPELPTPRAPLLWSLSVDGRSSWGPFPGQAFGFGLGLDVGGRRWFASIRGNASPFSESAVAPDAGVRFAAFAGSLSPCVRGTVVYSIVVAGCAGLQLTVLRPDLVGAATSDHKTYFAPVYAALPALRIAVPMFRAVSAQAGVELATSLNRPKFGLNILGDVHRVPGLVPSVSLGLSIDL
jgi:hypothetical protein